MIRLTILLLSISFWSTGQIEIYPQAPNLTTANLKGSVRSTEETRYIGWLENDDTPQETVRLNEEMTRNRKYVYDSLGHLLRVDFCVDERVLYSHTYIYTNGKLTESLVGSEHRIFEYDSQGRMVSDYLGSRTQENAPSEKQEPFDKSRALKNDYFYDSLGKLIAKKGTMFLGLLGSTDSIYYDDQNRPIKILTFADSYLSFVTMKYDSIGNLLRLSKGNRSERRTEKVVYTYENNELIKEQRKKLWDDPSQERSVRYYENGNEIKFVGTELYGHKKQTAETVYEYDDRGNWIKMTVIQNYYPEVQINTRKIEYYE